MFVSCIERGEQVENLVHDLGMPLFRLVDLVDADDRTQADLEGLRHNELGLRHRTFGGVHQNDGAVHHVQDALHLAAEVRVAGRVHDVDADVVPDDRSGLGQDGDAALAFLVVRIHHAFGGLLVLAEQAGLFQQAVDERGLAVVDMGDDGDVAQLHG